MDQGTEAINVINSAANGYWIPMAIVVGAFSLVLLLLLYIWNQTIKNNEKRHNDHEIHNNKQDELLDKVSENLNQLRLIVTELKTKQEIYSQKKIQS